MLVKYHQNVFHQQLNLKNHKEKEKKYVIYAPHWSIDDNRTNYATFEWNGKYILEYAKKHPEIKWIFKPHPSLKLRLETQKIMTNEEIEILIPSGTAIQNARTSYLGDNLNRDGTHLDYAIGRYIAALTFFAAVTDTDISAIEWSPVNVDDAADVDAAARAVAIESVINALKKPYEVTQSKYTELPQ